MARYSAEPTDGGFFFFDRAVKRGKTVRAFIDGSELKFVCLSDEERGYIEAAVTDANGNLAIGDDEVMTYRLYGHVRVIESDNPIGSELTDEEKAYVLPDNLVHKYVDEPARMNGKVIINQAGLEAA